MLAIVLPFVVAISSVTPDIIEYRVPQAQISGDFVTRWWRDVRPRREIRQEINTTRIAVLGQLYDDAAVDAADRLLSGKLRIPDSPEIDVSVPFSVNDIFQGPPTLQLKLAALAVPDMLLEAFLHSRKRSYLEHALQITEKFLEFEADLWLPKGFVWNDHAIAARTLFLVRLIDASMESNLLDEDRARPLLESLDRSVRRLAKPSQFTYRTNHGVIQSLVVLHVAIFCPDLPAVSVELQTVVDRLEHQMKFFVSPDGIVMEHSAGYHRLGTDLLRLAIRYFEFLEIEEPPDWKIKVEKASRFLTHITRPDGSLPRYGDTNGPTDLQNRYSNSVESSLFFSEDLGYWSSWFNPTAHLFVPWANFVSGAHKHADELSILFWKDGEEWWTAGGYWPYGYAYRKSAVSWLGSNAPHTSGEAYSIDRQSRVLRWASNESIEVLHLRRTRPDGYAIDRVIVTDPSGTWFVFDAPSGGLAVPTESSWMTTHYVQVSQSKEESAFLLTSSRNTQGLNVNFFGGPGASAEWQSAQEKSSLGWLGMKGRVIPTNTMLVETPPNSWSLVAWRSNLSDSPSNYINAVDWKDASNWTLHYDGENGATTINYRGGEIEMGQNGRDEVVVELTRGASERPLLDQTENRYIEIQAEYDRYTDLLPWRIKAFKGLAGMVAIHTLLLFGWFAHRRQLVSDWFLYSSLVAWTLLGVWLHGIYLTT